MHSWMVMFSYLSGPPDRYDARDDEHLERQVQTFADAKRVRRDRPPIGTLEFDWMTDQVDVYFQRNGRRIRFMTLMA